MITPGDWALPPAAQTDAGLASGSQAGSDQNMSKKDIKNMIVQVPCAQELAQTLPIFGHQAQSFANKPVLGSSIRPMDFTSRKQKKQAN